MGIAKADLIDIRPLPDIARSYCYASRVLYVDEETSAPLFVDLYDNAFKPWKVTVNRFSPIPVNDGFKSECITPGDANPTIYDLQNYHASLVFSKWWRQRTRRCQLSTPTFSDTRCPVVCPRL